MRQNIHNEQGRQPAETEKCSHCPEALFSPYFRVSRAGFNQPAGIAHLGEAPACLVGRLGSIPAAASPRLTIG